MITTYLDLFIKVVSREIITAVSENTASLLPCLEIPPLFLGNPQMVCVLLTKTHPRNIRNNAH